MDPTAASLADVLFHCFHVQQSNGYALLYVTFLYFQQSSMQICFIKNLE